MAVDAAYKEQIPIDGGLGQDHKAPPFVTYLRQRRIGLTMMTSRLLSLQLVEAGMDNGEGGIVAETDDHIDLCFGNARWKTLDNQYSIVEKDYHVNGEVWRVHKNDPDPFPSRPHAHCVGGRKRFIGCKLHLGTAELFRGRDAVGRRLDPDQFTQLIRLIQPKFPEVKLPLDS